MRPVNWLSPAVIALEDRAPIIKGAPTVLMIPLSAGIGVLPASTPSTYSSTLLLASSHTPTRKCQPVDCALMVLLASYAVLSGVCTSSRKSSPDAPSSRVASAEPWLPKYPLATIPAPLVSVGLKFNPFTHASIVNSALLPAGALKSIFVPICPAKQPVGAISPKYAEVTVASVLGLYPACPSRVLV